MNISSIRYNRLALETSLLLNAYSVAFPGYAYGKAGIALSLFITSLYKRDERIENHAFELLQHSLVYCGETINFHAGSSGIGFVLYFLIKHGYIEGEFADLFGKHH